MQIGMRQYDKETVAWFRQAVVGGETSRTQLASQLCERLDWRNAKGELCESSARKVLPTLALRLDVKLPAPVRSAPLRSAAGLPAPPVVCVSGSLADLGAVTLVPVVDEATSVPFRALMAWHHPEGEPRHPGKQLCWLIHSERHGVLGGIGFVAAGWHQQARDRFIGWGARARVANLHQVVNHHRFLLLPGVRVANLASHVLGQAVAALPAAWWRRHRETVVLTYTYVGPAHAGTCYRAAGWSCAGQTSGRSPSGGEGVRRTVWMRPLVAGWQATLQAAPVRTLPVGPARHAAGDWATREFGGNGLTDGRLRQRLIEMGRCWQQRPGAPVAEIFPEPADQRAAYRLLSNARVSSADVLESHQAMTVQRVGEADGTVLVVQDTTVLNYQTLRDSTAGLVAIGGGGSGSVGVVAHVLLVLTQTGQPLGVLDVEADFRAPGPKTARRAAAGAKKESGRWLRGFERTAELGRADGDRRVVTVGDREADLWALYARQAVEPTAGLLVRVAAGNRRRVQVGDETPLLEDYLASLAPCATTEVAVQARGGAHARGHRTVSVNLQIARVRVCAPRGEQPSHLTLTAVRVSDAAPEDGRPPLHWLLLCSEGEATAEWAQRIQGWYQRRWSIEEYFRVLKTGTRIEDRQLDAAEDLCKCLCFDAIAAWQVFALQRAARHQPECPAEQFVTGEQIEVLYACLRRVRIRHPRGPPKGALDIRTFVIDAARFAGFRPSRRQPLPGAQKLWSGLRYLQWALLGYQAAVEDESRPRRRRPSRRS